MRERESEGNGGNNSEDRKGNVIVKGRGMSGKKGVVLTEKVGKVD